MLAKFGCTNIAASFFTVDFLNFGIVIYLLWSSILFSTTIRAVVVVANLVTLGISFLTSFTLALKVVLVAELPISGIWFAISSILAL